MKIMLGLYIMGCLVMVNQDVYLSSGVKLSRLTSLVAVLAVKKRV